MKKNILFFVAMVCLSSFSVAQTFTFGSKKSVYGETFEVDSKGFVINGRRTLPVMGEIHYARVPAREWQREIRKMKAGGVTMIATYCFWNHHEEDEGVWNWEGNRNLRAFLDICWQEQMPVVLRIGPFCHGEVYQGGMPDWIVRKALADKAQYRLRSEASGFLSATGQLYQHIFSQIQGMLWKDGGPVVGIQIENECRGPWSYYMKLKDMAVKAGLDVPFYTRTGWPKLNGEEKFGQMLPLYGDYADGFWDRVLTDMPGEYTAAFRMKETRISGGIATETFGTNQDTRMEKTELAYPYLTCELGGGMMPSYHRRVHISGNEAMPLAICKLGSGSNLPGYYMYHGGTNPYNPRHTMAETQASVVTNYNDMPLMSYDFQCPLGEMGQPNLNAFHQTRLLHQFLADWGEELATMDVDTISANYARRGCFEFYNDYVRMFNEKGIAYVRPIGMSWNGHRLTAQAQPFCHIGDTLYLVSIKGMKPMVWIDGRKTTSPLIRILDEATARKAFKIGGRMYYAHHDGGILYAAGDTVREEYWHSIADVTSSARITVREDAPREVPMGQQKVAAMPTDSDFCRARVYDLDICRMANGKPHIEDLFLRIHYAADCARVYADGVLVADNFWNGKPMLVRLSDLLGKRVEMKILPLRKDAPVYLQKEQKTRLQAAKGDALLELDSILMLERTDEVRDFPRNICLEGQWRFGIDRILADSMLLPGSMPQRMKGYDPRVNTQWVGAIYDSSFFHNPYMEKYRMEEDTLKLPFFLTPSKHYVGKAWYERTITLPFHADTRYRLFLERPHIATELWVNGKRIGSQNSLSVPHIYTLDHLLHPGDNILTLCVDNDPKVTNVGQDSHSISDQTQGNWNGIVGRIELQAYNAIDHVKVYPDVDQKKTLVKVALDEDLVGKQVEIALRAEAFNSKTHHTVVSPRQTFYVDSTEMDIVLDMGSDMLLWDEYAPQLYHLTVETMTDGKVYVATTDFGMRKIEIRGKMFYVNNHPIQLRGTVENCCFPLTGYPPTDVNSWRRVFEKCKAWGLNHVRFHSYCPPEAAFKAADLTGIYLQPEGPSWPNHGVKLGRGEFIDQYLIEESLRITDTYGNHPSFCFFAFGNEPAGNWVAWCNEKMPLMEHHDPRHLYAGFSVGGGWAWQPKTQYAVKAGARGLDTWVKRQPEAMSDFSEKINIYNGKDMPGTPITIPFVSHETGQWCVFPNFSEITKYTGVNKARNFEIFRDLLNDHGMASRADSFLFASGKLQALCYKYELERHLRTPDYAGFQLLSLNDYSGQGTALVGLTDVFYDDKGYITASEFREFCSDIVPLAKISKFTYTPNETFRADLLLSWYAAQPCQEAMVEWSISGPDLTDVGGCLSVAKGRQGGLFEVGSLSVPLDKITRAGKYTLSVKVQGTLARNHWDFWVYPQQAMESQGEIYVTDTLDRKARRLLEKGCSVLLLAAGRVSYGKEVQQQFLPVFWNTSWFKMRPPHTIGLLIDHHHPMFSDFPTDSHSDLQWWELVNKAQVMLFTDFPADFQPTVQSIDTWFVSRKIGMLFEAKVGKGRLVMTTMDLTTDLDSRHVARQMRQSILRYMQSEQFCPKYSIDVHRISDLFTKVAGEVNMFTNDSPDELKPKLNN